MSGLGYGERTPRQAQGLYLWLQDGGIRLDMGRAGVQGVLHLFCSYAQSWVGHRLGNRAVDGLWGREDLILGPRSGHRTQFSQLRFYHPGPGRLHFACCDNSAPLSLEVRSSDGSQPCAPLAPRRTRRPSARGKVTACPLPPLEPHSLGWVPHCSPLSSNPGCPVASGASAKRDQLAWGRQGQLCESLKDG